MIIQYKLLSFLNLLKLSLYIYTYIYINITVYIYMYRVSQKKNYIILNLHKLTLRHAI